MASYSALIQEHGNPTRELGPKLYGVYSILVLPSGRRHRHTTRVLYLAPAVRRHRVHASGFRDLAAFLALTYVGSLVGPRIGSSPKSKIRRGLVTGRRYLVVFIGIVVSHILFNIIL